MIYKTENHNLADIELLLSDFGHESVFDRPIDRPVNVEGLKKTINNPNTLTIVAYEEDRPVAVFLGYVYNHPFFHAKFAADFLIYVIPEKRGSLVAVRLMKMYESWARNNNVNYISIGQSTGIGDLGRVRNFYEKLGYKTTGFNCLKGS